LVISLGGSEALIALLSNRDLEVTSLSINSNLLALNYDYLLVDLNDISDCIRPSPDKGLFCIGSPIVPIIFPCGLKVSCDAGCSTGSILLSLDICLGYCCYSYLNGFVG
jgi:hypothetical protein